MQRMGMVIGIGPDCVIEYKALRAAVWPRVLARLAASHFPNGLSRAAGEHWAAMEEEVFHVDR
jgi:hypothetical protein